MNQEALMFPVYIIELLHYIFILIGTPFLFPFFCVAYHLRFKYAFKRYHERMKNKPRLRINGVEQ